MGYEKIKQRGSPAYLKFDFFCHNNYVTLTGFQSRLIANGENGVVFPAVLQRMGVVQVSNFRPGQRCNKQQMEESSAQGKIPNASHVFPNHVLDQVI